MPGPACKRRVDGVQLLPGLGVAPLLLAERLPGEPSRMMLVVCFCCTNAAARRNERRNTCFGCPATAPHETSFGLSLTEVLFEDVLAPVMDDSDDSAISLSGSQHWHELL